MKWLSRLHRWFGLALGLLFVIWFSSGIVMMYAQMPALTEAERLDALPELELEKIALTPAAALAQARIRDAPERTRLHMLGERPAYEFLGDGSMTSVFADNGERFKGYADARAVEIAKAHALRSGVDGRQARRAGRIQTESVVQWTLAGMYRPLMPLHKVEIQGRTLYISDRSRTVYRRSRNNEPYSDDCLARRYPSLDLYPSAQVSTRIVVPSDLVDVRPRDTRLCARHRNRSKTFLVAQARFARRNRPRSDPLSWLARAR